MSRWVIVSDPQNILNPAWLYVVKPSTFEGLLTAERLLTEVSVNLKSVSEPYDTTTPVGRLVFNLLGSLAQWEKDSIAERTQLDRQRIVRGGRWAGGAVPFGYACEDGKLILSDHLVDPVGCTEAELMREIFVRVADGHSLLSECARLNALGIPSTKRYSSGRVVVAGVRWRPRCLSDLLHNPVYTGQHVYRNKRGEIHLEVPALVDKELWDRAHEAVRDSGKDSGQKLTDVSRYGGIKLCRLLSASLPPAPAACSKVLTSFVMDTTSNFDYSCANTPRGGCGGFLFLC